MDVQCPVEAGKYVVEQTVALPKEIPQGELPMILLWACIILTLSYPAKFTVNANGYTAYDEDLFCVVLKVNFMKRPFPKFSLGW